MTTPQEKHFQSLHYPCVLVMYGPSRNYRTTYRGENEEAFSIGRVDSAQEALERLKTLDYGGTWSELQLYTIHAELDDNGQPVVVHTS